MEADNNAIDRTPLPFLYFVGRLKRVPRTGWLRTIPRPESVADHSFRLAAVAMCCPKQLDRDKCVFMALCHDMAEAYVGDIPTWAGVSKEDKFKREELGTRYIQSLLQKFNPELGKAIRTAWLEYEAGSRKRKSPAAKSTEDATLLETTSMAPPEPVRMAQPAQ